MQATIKKTKEIVQVEKEVAKIHLELSIEEISIIAVLLGELSSPTPYNMYIKLHSMLNLRGGNYAYGLFRIASIEESNGFKENLAEMVKEISSNI